MKPANPIGPCAALCLFALTALPPGVAGATETVASPYRLNATAEGLKALPAAYATDTRYRLAPELQVAQAAPVAPDALVAAEAALADKPYARQIDAAARAAGVDPALVHALVSVESAYRATAVSPKGAVGLMQVLPQTASRYGVADASAVGDNLRAGTRHLRRLIDKYDERLDLALAAYNAGEGAVSRYHDSIPPYAETRDYVPKVMANYRANGKRADVPAPKRAASAAIAAIDYLPGTRLDTLALARLR